MTGHAGRWPAASSHGQQSAAHCPPQCTAQCASDLLPMIHSYRITKYTQRDRRGYLTSPPSEWTSVSDVGTKVTEADYLLVEQAYLDAIGQLCTGLGVTALRVNGLEPADAAEVHEGQVLDLDAVEHIARQVLRERLWCKLVAPDVEFHFGYDYYLYVVSKVDPVVPLARIAASLTVDRYLSPYLETAG